MAVPSDSTVETCIAIRNFASREIVLYLEPWAEEFSMAPQSELVLVGRGPQNGGGFSIDYREDAIVVSGWTGSVVQVFSQGNELGDIRTRPPVPDFDS
jgi:hypothetical protein